jgi:hypothetical protein
MRLNNNIIWLFVFVLLSSCGIINKSASSFGIRKYTQGVFWNKIGSKEAIVSNNVEKQSLVNTSGKIEHQNLIAVNSPEAIREIRGEKNNQAIPTVTLSKKQEAQALPVVAKEKTVPVFVNNNSTGSNTDPGEKHKITGWDILVLLVLLLLIGGIVLFLLGLVAFFVVLFVGVTAWFLLLLGLFIYLVAFSLFMGLVLGDRTTTSPAYKDVK